jgi:CRISPR-associated protein Cas1
MLNYAYGKLENDVRMHLVGAGFDLSIGVLHTSYERQQPLVYDLMEPLRPIVDRAILSIVQAQTFTPGDFTLLQSGVCRVNPQLAKSVVREIDCSGETEKLARQVVGLFLGR